MIYFRSPSFNHLLLMHASACVMSMMTVVLIQLFASVSLITQFFFHHHHHFFDFGLVC